MKYLSKNSVDSDTEGFSQQKFNEIYAMIGKSSKDYLPTVLDLIFLIKERFMNYMSNVEREKTLIAFGKAKLLKCVVTKEPLMLFTDKERSSILELIRKKQENFETLELELQLKFSNPNYTYANCLIESFIGNDYIPVPIIKAYDSKNLRTTYVKIGETSLIPEESMFKEKINKIEISNDIFNYDFDLVLSSEKKTSKIVDTKKATTYEYQNRYTITTLSKFWRLDIIEFGNAKKWELAENNWKNRPKTRVELEYVPAAFLKDLSQWENPKEIQKIMKIPDNIKNIKDFRQKVEQQILFLNQTDPVIILRDLGNILVKIFTVLDMDYGNIYSRKPKVQVENHDASGRSASIWLNMRKFHNSIKMELIIDVAKATGGKNVSLFDISVGRGGDLDKWNNAGIQKVRGIDPNAESISNAQERFNAERFKGRDYSFEQMTISDQSLEESELPKGKFDIVSCQFTLHYFFEDPDTLDLVIKRISDKLNDGGFFIGTTPIGERIVSKKIIVPGLLPSDLEEEEKPVLLIEPIDENTYRFKVGDVEESGHYLNLQDQEEYYVDFDKLVEVCNKYGLVLVKRENFETLYKNWKGKTKNPLKDYELYTNSLYDSFIFQKEF